MANWDNQTRLLGIGYVHAYPHYEYHLPTAKFQYLGHSRYSFVSARNYNSFIDYPRWIDNPRCRHLWKDGQSPYDEKEDGDVPTPIKWLDTDKKDCAVLDGVMDLQTPTRILHEYEEEGYLVNDESYKAHSAKESLNGYDTS